MEIQAITNITKKQFKDCINPANITIPSIKLNQTDNEYKANVMHKKSDKFITDNVNSGNFNNEQKIALILALNDVYKDNYPEYYKSSTGSLFYNATLVNLDEENLKYQLDIINRINFKTEYHLKMGISSLIAKINEEPSLYNNYQAIINKIIEASFQESKSLSDPSKKELQEELDRLSTKASDKESNSEFTFGAKNGYLSDNESVFSFGEKQPSHDKVDLADIENNLNPITKKIYKESEPGSNIR